MRKYLATATPTRSTTKPATGSATTTTPAQPQQQAIWLDDLPVGLIANGNQLHYVEPDHLGTPRVVIDVARNVPVWTWDLKSEAFGNSAPNQDPDGDANPLVFDMRFPGQRFDGATGLNYNYFRDYDPSTGRYATSDPIGLSGGLGTYAYAMSDPLLLLDSMGLSSRVLPRPIAPPVAQSGNAGDPNDVSGSNVIPFPGTGTKTTCPDNDCIERKVALMALHIQIDTAGILEHARGVFDSELTARKYAWNRSATNWNNTCVPLGYPEIEPVWFYELGPRKL